jgi:hypothetical protein
MVKIVNSSISGRLENVMVKIVSFYYVSNMSWSKSSIPAWLECVMVKLSVSAWLECAMIKIVSFSMTVILQDLERVMVEIVRFSMARVFQGKNRQF